MSKDFETSDLKEEIRTNEALAALFNVAKQHREGRNNRNELRTFIKEERNYIEAAKQELQGLEERNIELSPLIQRINDLQKNIRGVIEQNEKTTNPRQEQVLQNRYNNLNRQLRSHQHDNRVEISEYNTNKKDISTLEKNIKDAEKNIKIAEKNLKEDYGIRGAMHSILPGQKEYNLAAVTASLSMLSDRINVLKNALPKEDGKVAKLDKLIQEIDRYKANLDSLNERYQNIEKVDNNSKLFRELRKERDNIVKKGDASIQKSLANLGSRDLVIILDSIQKNIEIDKQKIKNLENKTEAKPLVTQFNNKVKENTNKEKAKLSEKTQLSDSKKEKPSAPRRKNS